MPREKKDARYLNIKLSSDIYDQLVFRGFRL